MKKIIFVLALICTLAPMSVFCVDESICEVDKTEIYYNEVSEKKEIVFDDKAVLIAVGLGFIPAIITVSVMKRQLQSVRFQPTATKYVRSGSFELTSKADIFRYSTVTKTERPGSERER